MKKFLFILILCLTTALYAQDDTKTSDLTELTAVADSDIMFILDGLTSKKITVINLFDTIDTSAELLAILTDETGTGAAVFGTAPTFTTSITITGADADPAAAGEIRYDNTITGIMSGGGLRWYDDDSVRLLVDLETDPSNDDYVVAYDSTADGFYMKADADSGGATAWDDITDPDNSGLTTITFDNAELTLFTGDNDAAASFITIQNTDADHTGGNFYLLDLDYSADDGDVDADFIKCQDSGGVVFTVQEDGKVAGSSFTDGTSTLTGGALTGLTTALTIAQGGTGATSLNDGFVLLGNATGAIQTLDVTTDGGIIIGDGTTDPVVLDVGSSTAITILGTIATGVWQGTAIADGYIPNNITIDLATTATNVTAADESTDDTCFPLFVTAATGNLPPKTGTNLAFASSTGVLTATEFSGGGASLTGVDAATGDSATDFFDAGALADARIPNNITIDLATLATTVTVSDDESTNDDHEIVFTTDNTNLESDGDFHYSPDTGTVTATEFAGGGGSLTGIDAATGDSATAFFDAGEIEHERGGLEADINAYTGLVAITGGSTAEVDSKSELEGHIADVADFAEADGDVYTGNADFGGGDLELPQASPAVPDADGEIEVDFTDGKLVIQHGSAHAELGVATDVAMGTLIDSWSGTIIAPDSVNDVITVKAINSIEFPHGVVITAIYLGVSSNTNYTLTVQNFDDFDTINGANGTIDTVAYTADTTGEVIDTTPTYATIAAGQIIMISIPSTDVDWIHFEIYYYEPAA